MENQHVVTSVHFVAVLAQEPVFSSTPPHGKAGWPQWASPKILPGQRVFVPHTQTAMPSAKAPMFPSKLSNDYLLAFFLRVWEDRLEAWKTVKTQSNLKRNEQARFLAQKRQREVVEASISESSVAAPTDSKLSASDANSVVRKGSKEIVCFPDYPLPPPIRTPEFVVNLLM